MYGATDPTAHQPAPQAPPRAPLDALIVGAGQAGLAVGYYLARHGLRFLIVDAAPEIGHTAGPAVGTLFNCSPRPSTPPCPACRSPPPRVPTRTRTRSPTT